LKYGLAVTGTIHPDHIWRNSGARPGDAIFLTKALGTGLLSTAGKKGLLSEPHLAGLIESMSTLNDAASRAARSLREAGGDEDPIHAATDVTGFGLLGSCAEVARASSLRLCIDAEALPALPGARGAADSGCRTRGERNNLEYLGDDLEFHDNLDPFLRSLVLDPQTSGGLLLFVAEEAADQLQAALREAGTLADARIGKVLPGPTAVEVR